MRYVSVYNTYQCGCKSWNVRRVEPNSLRFFKNRFNRKDGCASTPGFAVIFARRMPWRQLRRTRSGRQDETTGCYRGRLGAISQRYFLPFGRDARTWIQNLFSTFTHNRRCCVRRRQLIGVRYNNIIVSRVCVCVYRVARAVGVCGRSDALRRWSLPVITMKIYISISRCRGEITIIQNKRFHLSRTPVNACPPITVNGDRIYRNVVYT